MKSKYIQNMSKGVMFDNKGLTITKTTSNVSKMSKPVFPLSPDNRQIVLVCLI